MSYNGVVLASSLQDLRCYRTRPFEDTIVNQFAKSFGPSCDPPTQVCFLFVPIISVTDSPADFDGNKGAISSNDPLLTRSQVRRHFGASGWVSGPFTCSRPTRLHLWVVVSSSD